MAQVKLKGRMDTFFKLRTVVSLSLIITFFLTILPSLVIFQSTFNTVSQSTAIANNIAIFYSNPGILNFYGTIMGLLMAAYTVLISMIPVFHPESLKQPIFGQINRLFVFTIFIGLFSMLFNFVTSIINSNQIVSHYLISIEVFLFLSLILGLMFAVFSLSDMFNILRGRKNSRAQPNEKKARQVEEYSKQ